MRSLWTLLGIATAATLLGMGALSVRQDSKTQAEFFVAPVVGAQNGYILLPPEFVAQPFIRRIEWSPDGNYALLVQTAVRFEGNAQNWNADLRHRILAWNRKTKRVNVLWESPVTTVDIDPDLDVQMAFYKNAPACLLSVNETRLQGDMSALSRTVYYAPLNGRAVSLGQFAEVYLLAPPEDDARYVMWRPNDSEMEPTPLLYRAVSATGKAGQVRTLAPAVSQAAQYIGYSKDGVKWHADGKHIILTLIEPPKPDSEAQTPQLRLVLWNPRTNDVQAIAPSEVRSYAPRETTRLSVESAQQSLQHKGSKGATRATWLSEGEQATLVAADSALAAVSPQGDALLYVAHGAAFYRALLVVDRDTTLQMTAASEREQYLSQAKQIALALMMYVQDYDEFFPPNTGDIQVAEVLYPYLRNREVFTVDGVFAFRYLMDGQNLANIERPAETVVGYLQLPDGRVVIYGDGHVKWQSNR
ncbi:MAG: hypothetical protein P3X24_006115 [bacterium]|nr:hypothetical protein [bacterium]